MENIKELIEKAQLPAAVMGYSHNAKVQEWHSYGPSVWNEDSPVGEKNIFRIWSLTKAVTSVCAMQLVEAGKLSLHDPLNNLLPEMCAIPILDQDGQPYTSDKAITLHQLLTHTSGFAYSFTSSRVSAFDMKGYKHPDFPRASAPGEQYVYGTGINWVARAVEEASGMSLDDYVQQHICEPLGMDDTAFEVPESKHDRVVSWGYRAKSGKIKEYLRHPFPIDIDKGGGGLYSTPADYMKFLNCIISYGQHSGGQLLQKSTIEMMTQNHLPDGMGIGFEKFEGSNIDYEGDGVRDGDLHGIGWAINDSDEHVTPRGTVYWVGASNLYYSLDFQNQVAVLFCSQIFPFSDRMVVDCYRAYERSVYKRV